MKILTDENIMVKITQIFKNLGFDAVSVNNIKKGITDDEVLQIAIEQQRVLVTTDRKFSKKLKTVEHYGAIHIATSPQYQEKAVKKLMPKLKNHMPLKNKIITLTKDECRIPVKRKPYLPVTIKKISLI